MTRSSASAAIALLAAIVWPSAGAAQVTNATFINIYWVADGGDEDTWNADISNYSEDGGGRMPYPSQTGYFGDSDGNLTYDMIEGILHSITASKMQSGLTLWGASTNPTPLPGIVVGNCGPPPLTINGPLYNTGAGTGGQAIYDFIACVINNNPHVLDGGSIVLNVIVPPYVGESDWSTDFCKADGEGSGAGGFNWNCCGHQFTFIPTNTHCGGGTIPSFLHAYSHEMFETTSGNTASCDNCEYDDPDAGYYNGIGFMTNGGAVDASPPYSSYGIERCSNPNNGSISACVPLADAGANQTLAPMIVDVCGSGASMKIQAIVDHADYAPWDYDAGFASSMYVGVSVLQDAGPTTGVIQWTAGFSHYPTLMAPVTTSGLTWTEGTGVDAGWFVQFGMGTGYGGDNPSLFQYSNLLVPPGSALDITIYGQDWGQPSDAGWVSEVARQIAFLPYSSSFFLGSGNWAGNTAVLQGTVLGAAGCGLSGHTFDAGLPIEQAAVTCFDSTGQDAGPQLTNGAGYYGIEYVAPKNADGIETLNCFVTGGGPDAGVPDASYSLTVYPELDAIENYPAGEPVMYGPSRGGQYIVLHGSGFVNPVVVDFGIPGPGNPTPPTVSGALADPTGTTVTIESTPALTGGGDATVQVIVQSPYVDGGLAAGYWTNSLPYTYINANVPYVTFSPPGVICTDVSALSDALLIDDAGVFDTYTTQFNYASPNFPTVKVGGGTSEIDTGNPTTDPVDLWGSGNDVLVDATYEEGGADAGVDAGIPFYLCVSFPALLWWPPDLFHDTSDPYVLSGSAWITPFYGDPFDFETPNILGISSPHSLSDFELTSLGAYDLANIPNTYSSSYSMEVVQYATPSAENLCFTGSALGVALYDHSSPSWDITATFGLNPNLGLSASYYRVYGLSTTYNAWVEMNSSATGGSGPPSVTASLLSYDPNGVVSGAVSGPYMLAYYSSSACP